MIRQPLQGSACIPFLISAFFIADHLVAQTPIHNPNNYDIWVSVGSFSEGVISLTGGENAPDTFNSKGWFRIPAKGNLPSAVAKTATHILGFAYDIEGEKVTFNVNDKTRQSIFYYSPNQFSKDYRASSKNSLVARTPVKKKKLMRTLCIAFAKQNKQL